MPTLIRALIADGHPKYRAQLAAALSEGWDISVIAAVGTSTDAVSKVLEFRPDVILLNATLPGASSAVLRIKERVPSAVVLLLTDADRRHEVTQAMASRASGSVIRGTPDAEVAMLVREKVASTGMGMGEAEPRHKQEREARLSTRELGVLGLLGEGLSNREIAERLVVTESTVKTYVYRLREKLRLKNRLELGLYAANRRTESGIRTTIDIDSGRREKKSNPSPSDEGTAGSMESTGRRSHSGHAPAGERKLVTALSVELSTRDNTEESMGREEWVDFLHQCLDLIAKEIHVCQGTVGSYTSGGVMAFFGVHTSQEHSPQKALHAALAIRERIRARAAEMNGSGPLVMRIGVGVGTVATGRDVDGHSMRCIPEGDLTDSVVRARDAAEADSIGVTESAYRLARQQFAFEPQGEVWVRGPVRIYRLLGSKPATERQFEAASPSLTEFMGRQKEIGVLEEAFAKANTGAGQVIGIVGEAGVGKSRLLLEFRNRLRAGQTTYLEGSCIHYAEPTPYLAFQRALRSFFEVFEGDPESAIDARMKAKVSTLNEGAVRVRPPLRDVLSLKVDDETYLQLEPAQRRKRVFEAVRDIILLESTRRTVVLAFEDLQWVDRTSEELLSYLIDGLAAAQVMFVLVYRPECSHRWANRSEYRQISLNQFPPDVSADFIRAVLGHGEVTPGLSRLITDRAGGNPLFI